MGGAEAEAAILGALTTPGTTRPLAILDLGAGSTDASIINAQGEISATHLAGAGDMVTMIIARELGLEGPLPGGRGSKISAGKSRKPVSSAS